MKQVIQRAKLDVSEKLKKYPKRLNHVLSTAQKASELARLYNLDQDKAYLAGLFHDYTKYDDLETQKLYLNQTVIEKYRSFEVNYHAYSAAEILKTKYHINDESILNAIRYHVIGHPTMDRLAKVVLLADKIEETRMYPQVDELRGLSKHSLDQPIKRHLNFLKTSLLKQEKFVHPELILTIERLGDHDVDLLKGAMAVLEKVNAKEINVFDFKETSPFYDYFLVGTVNDRQGSAAVSYFGQTLKKHIKHIEGRDSSGWVLIDLGDVVVHLFKEAERTFYGFDQRFMEFRK